MCFDVGACTFFGDRSKESCDAFVGWRGGGARDLCNRWEEEVEALEDFGGGVGGLVEEVAEGMVEFVREEVAVDSETSLGVACGGGHCDDKVRGGAGVGHRRPRPPEARPSWLMRTAEGGMVGWSTRVVRKVEMMVSISEVRGPFHSSQLGLGSLRGRL